MYRRNGRLAPLLALSVVLALGLAGCGDDDESAEPTDTTARVQGSDSVDIIMSDYAYAVSGPLTEGGSLKISNTGKEIHMIGLGKLKPGKTLEQLRDALLSAGPPGGPPEGGEGGATTTTADGDIRQQVGTTTSTAASGRSTTTSRGATTTSGAAGREEEEEEDPTAEFIEEVGFPGNVMSPGQSVEVTVPNLTPGTYALVCFIPTEGEGRPHFHKGMISSLEVVEGTRPPEPNADATYKVATGKAVEGPATLTAGRHILKIEADSGSEQLEPTLAKLNPGRTYAQLNQAVDQLFESEEPPPPGSAAGLPGQFVFAGFDLEGVTSFYLTADLTAGDYVVAAADRDREDAPSTPREIINIKVT